MLNGDTVIAKTEYMKYKLHMLCSTDPSTTIIPLSVCGIQQPKYPINQFIMILGSDDMKIL